MNNIRFLPATGRIVSDRLYGTNEPVPLPKPFYTRDLTANEWEDWLKEKDLDHLEWFMKKLKKSEAALEELLANLKEKIQILQKQIELRAKESA